MKQSVFAVIAAKDESSHIKSVVTQTLKYVDQVIVVDDGSKDDTYLISKKAGANALKHIVNLGKGAAIKTGCEYAISHGANIIVLLDADGQHEPKEIPKFLELLVNNDIVVGVRTERESMPRILKFGNRMIYAILKILFNINIKDPLSGYRAFKTEVYPKLEWRSPGYTIEIEMVTRIAKKRLKYSTIKINTIYADRYKGTTIIDGIKIGLSLLRWRLTR